MPWMNPKDGNHAWAHEWRPWLEAINIKAMGGAPDEGRGWDENHGSKTPMADWMETMDRCGFMDVMGRFQNPGIDLFAALAL